MVQEKVLRKCGSTTWALPTFITQKKADEDGNNIVRWVSDFRELNKVLERAEYPIPRIKDIMLKQQGYKHFTKIDLSMMFYCFELDKASKELCHTFQKISI